jgi:hypothetical protein
LKMNHGEFLSIGLRIFLLMPFLINFSAKGENSGFKVLSKTQRYKTLEIEKPAPPVSVKPPKVTVSKKTKTPSADLLLLQNIHSSNLKIQEMLGEQSKKLAFYDGTTSFKIPTGTTIQGALLNSVVSTNLESPLLVTVLRSDIIPLGTKFSCEGVTKNHRVISACNLMITPTGEYSVSTILLNTDGTAGLQGEIYDSREKYMAASIATSLAQGIIAGTQDRVSSFLGEMKPNNTKNRTLEGVLEAGNNVTNLLNDEIKKDEVIVSVNAGTRVLIYFKQRFEQ